MPAEKDLAGYDDCDSSYSEIAVDTDEHVRHSAYWAVSTQRGQDFEEPDRWADFFSMLEGVTEAVAGAIVNVGSDLEETDSRVKRALYSLIPGEVMRWAAEITTRSGSVTVEGPAQPYPQDVAAPAYSVLPDPGPLPAGVRSIRGAFITGGIFPYWILGPNSGRIIWATGLLLDMAQEWLEQGIQQRFPLLCDTGALPWLSRDLGIFRGANEDKDAFRVRLSRWVPTWRRAGNAFAILEQAQAYHSPQAPVVHLVQHDPGADGKPTRATWCTRHADGSETVAVVSPSNWDFDSTDPARPASLDTRDPRVHLIIEQPPGDTTCLFASRSSASAATRDTLGMNGCVRPGGGRAPAAQYADLRAIVRDWRAMGTWVATVLVSFGALAPTGTGAGYPDGRWWDPLNSAHAGNRIPDTIRLLFKDNFPGDRLPESPVPYVV